MIAANTDHVEQQMERLSLIEQTVNGLNPLPITLMQPEKFKTYEWDEQFGDVPPHNEALKNQLFKELSKTMTHTGDHFKVLNDFAVKVVGNEKIDPIAKARHFEFILML